MSDRLRVEIRGMDPTAAWIYEMLCLKKTGAEMIEWLDEAVDKGFVEKFEARVVGGLSRGLLVSLVWETELQGYEKSGGSDRGAARQPRFTAYGR